MGGWNPNPTSSRPLAAHARADQRPSSPRCPPHTPTSCPRPRTSYVYRQRPPSAGVPPYSTLGTARRRPSLAEGDAFPEEISQKREAVVEGYLLVYVLHRVLYPQVHVNGVKKKKKVLCTHSTSSILLPYRPVLIVTHVVLTTQII
jgi:hypothetical protein